MNTTEWLEAFTGQKLATGADTGNDLEKAAAAAEKELALKAALLAEAHKRVKPLKAKFQAAMEQDVAIKGKFFKQKLLDVEGTQMDEAEWEEIDWRDIKLEPGTEKVIKDGSNLIMMTGDNLAATMTQRDGETVPLFKAPELEDGYWFPLTRERILPETFIGALYSKTQRMITETNEAYQAEVERKREKGQLTPKANRARDLVQSGADIVMLGGDMVAAFGPGTDGAKLATTVLTGVSQVISGAGDVYDKVKAREYADGATATIGTLQILTKMVLSSVGIDKSVVDIVDKSFTVGGKAIAVGKAFAQGVDGAADGMAIFADVLAGALTIAVDNTKGQTKTDLQLAVSTAPNVFRAGATSVKLLKALDQQDPKAVVDCLGEFAGTALNTVQGVRKAESEKGKTDDQVKDIDKRLDKQTDTIQGIIDLGTAGGKTIAAMAIAARRGRYEAIFDALIDAIGENLEKALTTAGLPDDRSKQIALLYKSASSGSKAVECLINDPKDVNGALGWISNGVASAFEGAAPGSKELQKVGEGVATALQGMADAKTFVDKCKKRDYDGAFDTFSKGFKSQLGSAFKIAGVDQDDDGGDGSDKSDDGGDSALKDALVKLGVEAKKAEKLIDEHADDAVEKEVDKQTKAQAEAEAQAILDEVKADMSDPEKFAREASDIDALIARMERDRMIMRIAVQIMQGGTAFLATFIPGLGAAPAAIKMMASLVAAAQRAQQLAYWVNSQQDLAAAQSALTSSAQNFVMNQAEQFTHHTIQAAFAAAEMIGQVLRVAGAATYGAAEAAGVGLVAASKAGAKLEEIIRRHYKTEQLEAAWKLTQRSIRNPTNRKLGLRARAQNPSLAKYSIAWGAVKLKDPIARQALRACELTEAVLENENANIDKVVQYLESFYEEDDKLYREVEETAKWVPKDIELTLRFWSKLKTLAVDKVKLANTDTGVLDGLLARLKEPLTAKSSEADRQQRILLLKQIDRELGAYAPQIKDAKGLQAFGSVVKLLRNKATAAVATIEAQIEKAAKEREEKSEKEKQDRAKELENRDTVIEELKGQISTVQDCTDDDDASDLMDAYALADKLIKEVSAMKPYAQDTDVQGAVKVLMDSLESLDILITQTEMPVA